MSNTSGLLIVINLTLLALLAVWLILKGMGKPVNTRPAVIILAAWIIVSLTLLART